MLDLIYASPGLVHRTVLGDKYKSDHLPLFATISVNGCPVEIQNEAEATRVQKKFVNYSKLESFEFSREFLNLANGQIDDVDRAVKIVYDQIDALAYESNKSNHNPSREDRIISGLQRQVRRAKTACIRPNVDLNENHRYRALVNMSCAKQNPHVNDGKSGTYEQSFSVPGETVTQEKRGGQLVTSLNFLNQKAVKKKHA